MDWPPIAGDPRFFRRSGPYSLAAVADAAGADAPPRRLMLSGVAPLQSAESADVSFFDNRKYADALADTRAGAVIVRPDMAERVPSSAVAIVTDEPYVAWARVAALFHPIPPARPGVHPSAVETFQEDGYTRIEEHAKSLPEAKLLEAASDAYLIGIRSATRITARVLEHAPKLLGIGCFCIGTNQVALDAAQMRGIPVFNAPFSNTRSVAELVLAEIIMLLRGIPYRNAMAHRGGWIKTASGSYEVRGKCLGGSATIEACVLVE